eukprot:scaffold58026_cov61-Phaeocystis_antarctica.AAC.2
MVLGDGCLTLRRDECRRYLVFGFSLAHTLLASHVFNGSRIRLPHAQVSLRRRPYAQARWLLMIFSVWYSLAHTLLASHAFNGSMRRLPHAQARRVQMISCVLVQLGSPLLASSLYSF